MYAIDAHVLVRDGETPLNVLKLFDVSEYSGEGVGISVVILRNLSVVYDDNGAYSLPQGGTYEYSLPVNGDVVAGGDYVVECVFKNLGTNATTVVRRSFTLEYTPPVVNPYITVDGLRSKLYGGATMTGVASVLSKSFIHTLPQGGTVVNSDNYEIDGIYSGVHSLVVRYDLSIASPDYVLYDSVYGSLNVIAYKLDAKSVFGDVSNYRALYERTSNLGLKRQMHTTLKTIEAWADDYHNNISIGESLAAYDALRSIYIALNGVITPTVELIQPTTILGNYLTKVEHDDTLVGSGIAGDELGVNTADSTIDGLKDETSGGEVPDEDYNWFKSLYASLVDGSVKSWIMGLVNQLKALADRVGLIDDNAYLEQFKISVKHLIQYDWFNAAKTTGTGVTSVNTVENRIIMNPIAVSDNITIDLMAVRIAVGYAGGKMRLAIYEGKPFYPFSLIWQSEEILIETASLKQVPLNLTLYKNKCYWLCVLPNTSNVKLYSFQVYQVTPISGNDAISTSSNSNLYVNYPYGILPTNLEGYVLNAQYTYVTNISLRKA